MDARHTPGSPVAVLINNLGAVPQMEMAVVARELLRSAAGPRVELLVGPGAFVTALDMNGLSLSFMVLNDELREALKCPVDNAAWRAAVPVTPINPAPLPAALSAPLPEPSANPTIHALISAVAADMIASEVELNALDARARFRACARARLAVLITRSSIAAGGGWRHRNHHERRCPQRPQQP